MLNYMIVLCVILVFNLYGLLEILSHIVVSHMPYSHLRSPEDF